MPLSGCAESGRFSAQDGRHPLDVTVRLPASAEQTAQDTCGSVAGENLRIQTDAGELSAGFHIGPPRLKRAVRLILVNRSQLVHAVRAQEVPSVRMALHQVIVDLGSLRRLASNGTQAAAVAAAGRLSDAAAALAAACDDV